MIWQRKNVTNVGANLSQKSILRSSFLSAGLLFVATCLVGLFTKLIIEATTNLVFTTTRFSFYFWSDGNASTARGIFIAGAVSLFISMIMSLIWAFRLFKASKVFIVANYIVFAFAQGVGFGALFLVFNAFELISIFGIAGGLFLAMAAVGFIVKDASRLYPYIMVGTFIVLIMGIVSMILYFTNVYSDTFTMLILTLSGVLFLLYIVYDIWAIRKTSQYQEMTNGYDADTQFRLVAWFGFRLASDLIGLIWIIARLYLRISK